MNIDVLPNVTDERLDETWRMYEAVFSGPGGMAAHRHPMRRPDFDDMMRDRRIDKWLVRADGGTLLAAAVYTNDLGVWPLVSPEYFAQRWPREHAERRIWYCGFVAVAGHDREVFVELMEAMYRRAEEQHGIVSLDLCRHNLESYRLDPAVAMWMNRISGGQVYCDAADRQAFTAYETTPSRPA
jgi:hypothetical protein